MIFITFTLVSLTTLPSFSSDFGIRCSDFSSGLDLTSSITDVLVTDVLVENIVFTEDVHDWFISLMLNKINNNY